MKVISISEVKRTLQNLINLVQSTKKLGFLCARKVVAFLSVSQRSKEYEMKQRVHLCPSEVVSSLRNFEIVMIFTQKDNKFFKMTIFQTSLNKFQKQF
ncbi:hypothetical protein HYU21_00910 [Candidatus Woesearchaeota archaeon]|nr:hypothetical protein [Candidatus Woesearchaeota archaeon]